ncbi:MAG TPA: glycosyltransferase 87 family protein [Actinophytocola sp.]|uniref:glycosyltransferase 87 family protein n=1 Tax=Actinophytocola sp. TaxID=1872138 RepID=UPI002E004EB8|nr:glycosyltransferase 87 family protein [Actinophytocola sp.]
MTLAPLRIRTRPGVLVAPAVLLLLGVVGWLIDWPLGVDSTVYRSGAVALLHGEPLYDAMSLSAQPSWARLPFTYPPIAALLFTPMALFPTQVSWGLLAVVSMLSLVLVVRVVAGALPHRPSWLTPARATVLLPVLFIAFEPVCRTILLGQINLVLMAFVVLDVLVLKGSRFSGVLIGAASAVKLTPLIFVPYLLLTRRWADALRATGTFAGLQALLLLVIPHDVARYWSDAVFDPERTGPIHWGVNQSLNGLMLRLTDRAPWSLTVALAIGALLAVPVALAVRRLHRRGQEVPALLMTAFFGLLVSPVSWTHHWVWAVPLVVYLLARLPEPLPAGRARLRVLAGPGALVAVFVLGLLLILGVGPALQWSPVDFVPGSVYLIAGAFVLVRLPVLSPDRGP